MPGIFNAKYFNPEVFGKYVETVPRVKQNAFLSSGVFRERNDIKAMFNDQTGGNYATFPMKGRIGGTPDNYDGNTDITADTMDTYSQSAIAIGRAHSWKEKDFTFDITRHDFMNDIASQVSEYWDDVDQTTVLAILEGIFGVTTDGFNTKHTLDISGASDPGIGATTLNTAIQQASGANKNIYKMAIMHSAVATNLENLQVLTYWKETDANGIQRDLALASWNGRTVLVDDEVPVDTSGTDTKYTTYILGAGAFGYCNVGAKVPYETTRDAIKNGGEDLLVSRQRKIFAPTGFSFVQPSTAIISPTDAQLKTAARWTVVKDTTGSKYFDSKAIPFARIISLG